MTQTLVKDGRGDMEAPDIATWLERVCQREHISLRTAAKRADLSHATLAKIKNGERPSASTVSKLAKAFSNNGPNSQAALEDRLLTLGGFKIPTVEVEHREPLARLIDKLEGFNDDQLAIMEHLVDFCGTLGDIPWGIKKQSTLR